MQKDQCNHYSTDLVHQERLQERIAFNPKNLSKKFFNILLRLVVKCDSLSQAQKFPEVVCYMHS